MSRLIKFISVAAIFLLLNIQAFGDDSAGNNSRANFILVEKSERLLTLFTNDKVIKSYRVALGRNPAGPKFVEGDMRTPEGFYIIDSRNPDSSYHLSLHISYPNEIDRQLAGITGVSPGGSIVIHGTGEKYAWMGKYHTALDWTEGCIAVTNEEIEEIWGFVPDGTLIEIRP